MMKIPQALAAVAATLVWIVPGCHAFLLSNGMKPLLRSASSFHSKDTTATPSRNFVTPEAETTIPSKSSALFQSSSPSSTTPSSPPQLDVEAMTKYGAAIAIQLTLVYGVFSLLDLAVATTGFEVPFWANVALFYAFALKSRVFNPLSNKRPDPASLESRGQPKRTMPSWTPPGVVFPIMWLLIIGPIRAYTTAMVYDVNHLYADPAIMALAIHLSIGDVWNTINNVEQRFGTSVSGVACVWLSKANTAYQYAKVLPLAGEIMAIPLLWLTVAGALVTRTWQLNPNSETGDLDPLYPIVGKTKTEFEWLKSSG